MDICICISAFNKPKETLFVIESIEKCYLSNFITLLIYIDTVDNGNISYNNNQQLIKNITEYKNNKFKNIIVHITKKNEGPYLACFNCIEKAFTICDFVVFGEDDILFSKDALVYYYAYYKSIIPNNDDKCIGITTSSINFGYLKKELFEINNGKIVMNNDLQNKFNDAKDIIESKKLLYCYQYVKWAPNKQFGLFQKNWNKIKYYRSDEFLKINKTDAPDAVTGYFVNKNNYYFIYSYIPRSNDIGLYHDLGCTTLYYKGIASPDTIKYITSDDFEHPTDINIIYDQFKLLNEDDNNNYNIE